MDSRSTIASPALRNAKMTVEIDLDIYEKLTALKMQTGFSYSELLRELIRWYYASTPSLTEYERENESVDGLKIREKHNILLPETNHSVLKGEELDKKEQPTDDNIGQELARRTADSLESKLGSASGTLVTMESCDGLTENKGEKESVIGVQKGLELSGETETSEEIPNSQIALVLLSMSQSGTVRTSPDQSSSLEVMGLPQASNNGQQEGKKIVRSKIEGNDRSVIKTDNLFKCSRCSYECKKRSDLETHDRKHTGDRPFKCSQCPASFKQRPHLKYHELAHSGSKLFVCATCKKSFRTISKLRAHMKESSHEQPQDQQPPSKAESNTEKKKIWSCQSCNYSTTRSGDLKKHENIHSAEKTLHCEFCNFKTTWKKNLTVHRRRHTGEQPHSCDLCDFKTHDSRALTNHKLKVHPTSKANGEGTSKRFVCDACGAVFSQAKLLRQHVVIHTGEKPFECPQCSYRTGFQSNLRSHMVMHKAVKEFVCEHCGKSFRWKHHLRGHQKNIHPPTEKIYSCEICQFTTKKSQSLNSHKRLHRKKRSNGSKAEVQSESRTSIKHAKVSYDETVEKKTTNNDNVGNSLTIISDENTTNDFGTTPENYNRDHSYSAIVPSGTLGTGTLGTETLGTASGVQLSSEQEQVLYTHSNTAQLEMISGAGEQQGIGIEGPTSQGDELRSINVETPGVNDVTALSTEMNEEPIYDQQGNNIFHYDGMAAVINNMIIDFEFHP